MSKLQQTFISLFTILVCLCFVMIGCKSYECCFLERGPEVAWPKPVSAKAPEPVVVEPKPEIKVIPKEEVVAPKPVEDSTPIEKIETPAEKQPEEIITPPPLPIEEEKPIVEPKVSMTSSLEGDAIAKVGVAANLVCKVTNTGQQIVESYQVKVLLPDGLMYEDSPNERNWLRSFSQLEVQSPQAHKLRVVGTKAGSYKVRSEVLVKDKSVASSEWQLEVKEKPRPKVEFNLQGPSKVYVGSEFEYIVSITNKGEEPLAGILIQNKIPKGVIYRKSEPEGKYKEDKNSVAWEIANLAVGQQENFKLKVTSLEKSSIRNFARVKLKTEQNPLDEKYVDTEMMAEAGLQIKQYDTSDPVEVGQKTTYVIELNNDQGLKDVTDVQVVDILPGQVKFIEAAVEGADAPVKWEQKEDQIVFETIPLIAIGARITIKVTVEIMEKGDLLNTVEVRSNEFKTPIRKQEPTSAFAK